MSCDRYRNALTDAAAGEPVTPALEVHLAGCGGCRSELAQLRLLMATAERSLFALASAEPSPALRARIRQAVAGQPAAPALRFRLAWPVAAAAVVAVAAFGVWRSVAGRAPAGPIVAESAPPPTVAEATAPAATAAAASLGPGRAASSVAELRPSSVDRSVPPRSAHGVEPEVLVPAGGHEALLRYVALVHREGLDAPVLAAVGQPSPNLAEPRPIEVRPLEIAPVDPAEDSET